MTKSLDKLNASIELQAKKLAAMKAEQQKHLARERTKKKLATRSADTRRKILLGSYVLAAINIKGEQPMTPEIRALRLRPNSIALDAFLTREDDRALFGYPPLVPVPVPSPAPASPSSSVQSASATPGVASALPNAPDNQARRTQPQTNVYVRPEAKDLL